MSHKKFEPDRFSRFDVYWIQTDRQTNRQTDKQTNRQAKFIYRFGLHMTEKCVRFLNEIFRVFSLENKQKYFCLRKIKVLISFLSIPLFHFINKLTKWNFHTIFTVVFHSVLINFFLCCKVFLIVMYLNRLLQSPELLTWLCT